MFLHLRTHSSYSLAEGAILMDRLPTLAKENNMPAIALTDTHNMFGVMEFCLGAVKQGIQPIIGSQIYLKLYEDTPAYPVCLLVRNHTGYQNLSHLMSQSYTNQTKVINLKDLQNYNQGLICFSGAQFGPLAGLLRQNDGRLNETILHLKELFSDNFFMEIMRFPHSDRLENSFLSIATKENIPLVATNDVYFENEDMYEAHDALLCISQGKYISEADRRRVTPHHYFKSEQEMKEVFHNLEEAINNTVYIAKKCTFHLEECSPVLPHYPNVITTEEETLKQKAHNGLKDRLIHVNPSLHEEYKKRLAYELGVISKMGFCGYFLIVADFISWAKQNHIPVGAGRGSGAGSLVAYALTITDIDPIRFGLIFERFLNPERVSMPDFDVDFCQEKRDLVIQYVQERYGKDCVAHIITFGKFQPRMALRDIGRVLHMPYPQVDRICKLVPNNPSHPVTLPQALEIEPALKEEMQNDEMVKKLIETAIKIEGLYRHASTHAAGVVIADQPLEKIVPLFQDPDSTLPATQFSMKYVEKIGLVKFDFLGLKTLTVIDSAVKMICQNYKIDFKIEKIAFNDQNTFNLLSEMKTFGVFQLESPGMRDILKKLKPDQFEDLIALVSLYRPGPMDDIPKYLARKHKKEPIVYLHPALKEILEPTYGVMVYQEQVIKIAQVLGGYSAGEADLLRRAMGKKIASEMKAQQSKFVNGAIQKGVSEKIALEIFEQMEKFSGYGFNKSHAAPYALLSYQTAYLKANYPKEFFASTLTHDMHNIDKIILYKQDMEKMDIPLFLPDINKSFAHFVPEEDGVRYGLAAIKNIGTNIIEMLTKERKKGEFTSFNNFVKRVDSKVINKRVLENLIAGGVFDSIEKNRKKLWDSIEETIANKGQARQQSLFGGSVHKKKDWPAPQRLKKEFEALGLYMSAHPLSFYKQELDTLRVISSNSFEKHHNETIQAAGVLIAKKEKISKKSGKKFAILTFSDFNGTFEATLFGDSFQEVKDILNVGESFLLNLLIKCEENSYRLLIQSISRLVITEKHFNLSIPHDMDHEIVLKKIKEMDEGNSSLTLIYFLDGEKGEVKFDKKFNTQQCQELEKFLKVF